jgi:hypothetical protein
LVVNPRSDAVDGTDEGVATAADHAKAKAGGAGSMGGIDWHEDPPSGGEAAPD